MNQVILNCELKAIIEALNRSGNRYRVGAVIYSKDKIKIKLSRGTK